MKKLSILVVFISVHFSLYAQKKPSIDINEYISKLPVLNIGIPKIPAMISTPEKHFSKFTVLDYRPDLDYAGLCLAPEEMQISLNNIPVQKVVDEFFNRNYVASNFSNEVIVVLKKLWYSSMAPEDRYLASGFEQALYGNTHQGFRLQFAAESYLKTDAGFIPFAAFDTTIVNKGEVKVQGSSILATALSAFVNKLNSKNIERTTASRKPFDKTGLDSISKRNFQYSIYKDDSLKKGIYTTAKEFFNNQPTNSWYEIHKDKDEQLSLYLKNEKGQKYLARNIWGFCDGTTSYVMIDENLFPIYRNGNAFFTLGSKVYQIKRQSSSIHGSPYGALGAAIADDLTPYTKRKKQLFIVDSSTGEVL